MSKTNDFNEYKEQNTPHVVHEAICVYCNHRWIMVRPEYSLLKDMECPMCFNAGYVIKTGQEYKEFENA